MAPNVPDAGSGPDAAPSCSSPLPDCRTEIATTVPVDDNSLGFTATDVLAELGRPNTGEITWYDGTSTALHMQVRYADSSVRIDTSRDLTALDACRWMFFGAMVSLSTDDGRLSGEDFPAIANARVVNGTKAIWLDARPLDFAMLHGSFRVPDSWNGGNVTAQTLRPLMAIRQDACTDRSCNALDSKTSFANEGLCGFDGKIWWTGQMFGVACYPQGVVGAWRWQP